MSVDADVWSCPDCHETVRGTARERASAQAVHGAEHRNDRNVEAARLAQLEEDRRAAREERLARAFGRKQAAKKAASTKRGRGAR